MSQTSPVSRWKNLKIRTQIRKNERKSNSQILVFSFSDLCSCFLICVCVFWFAFLFCTSGPPQLTHSSMFISSSSLAFLLPPPGSLDLLLSSSDSSVLFYSQSLPLLGSTEKRLAAASPDFSCIFYGRKFEFQAVLFFLFQLWQLLCCHGDGYTIARDLAE